MSLENKNRKRCSGRFAAVLWLLFFLVSCLFLLCKLPSTNINSNILDMLPQPESEQVNWQTFLQGSEKKIIFAIKGPEEAAQYFWDQMDRSTLIEEVLGKVDEKQIGQVKRLFEKYKVSFLSDSVLEELSNPEKYATKILKQLYSPISPINGRDLKNDPLLLAKNSSGTFLDSRLVARNGWLQVQDANNYWTTVFVELKDHLSVDQIHIAVDFFKATIQKVEKNFPGCQVLYQGIPFHSDLVANTTKEDIAKLGGISVLALVLLIWWSYKSLKPLILCLVSILVGLVVGLSANILFFGQLHAITLVMCVSLIGLATDYTTYFCAMRSTAPPNETSAETMVKIRPSLVHAVLTTVIAYAVLLIAPFPGLRELAVFAVFGLVASCVTVLLWFPLFPDPSPGRNEILSELGHRYIEFWAQKKYQAKALVLVILVFCLLGLNQVFIDDSLLYLQTPNPTLIEQEKRIFRLLGREFSQQTLIIEANNEEELLDRLYKVRQIFDKNQMSSKSFLPPLRSIAKQRKANEAVLNAFPSIKERLLKNGIRLGEISPAPLLSWEEFLNSSLGKNYRDMYQKVGEKLIYAIPVTKDPTLLEELHKAELDVYIHDHRSEIEKVLSSYRSLIGKLLFGSYFLILVSFLFKFGFKSTLAAATSLMLSLGCGLAVLGFVGWPINIFSLFALILVLGIGVDYQVFFQQLYRTNQSASYALLVAAATTLMSLGILVFSSTLAVQNFGLVLSVGVLTAFLTSPISFIFRHEQKK